VFQNFEWDKEVKDKSEKVQEFKDINILYGRNYSGKTTLSRILRAMETGILSDKYENPDFCISFKNGDEIDHNCLKSHHKKIRVFNEDFVRDHLKFINDPDQNVESFAILGDNNNKIETEIKALENKIGCNEEGKETGLYAQLKIITASFEAINSDHQTAKNNLDKQLTAKATDKKIGIRYQSEKFGDQNYDIAKLRRDIEIVSKKDFVPITNEHKSEKEKLINEKIKIPIGVLPTINLKFNSFLEETGILVTQKIGISDKIDELVKNAILNKWVKEGHSLNKERKSCAFCGNNIDKNRWDELDKHFDDESEILEKNINKLIQSIDEERNTLFSGFTVNKNLFYATFHQKVEKITGVYTETSKKYEANLNSLLTQLNDRKNDLINPKVFNKPQDFSNEITTILDDYERIRLKSNKFTDNLDNEKVNAKNELLLSEVFDFLSTIKYADEINNISNLKTKEGDFNSKKNNLIASIIERKKLIASKKKQLNDEGKGADKVNEYLNNFFGHNFLSLEAKIHEDNELDRKRIEFTVIRDGKKAYHLSGGECNLLAFCYFLAKLEDINTKGEKPIIWIDDPISSFDGNHIFFTYSLLRAEIVDRANFKQLFISTHNLHFLKYLKRLTGKFLNHNFKMQEYDLEFFMVQRHHKTSTIKLMPMYLKKYATEFNYLFHQIRKCSNIVEVDDANYTCFCNFGNNARKFLEIYLYYKYPDDAKPIEKYQRFFGENIPAFLIDRINNEYSHMLGAVERGATPIEVPEMNTAAKQIMKRIEETDPHQYKALLHSIGEKPLSKVEI